MPPIDSLTISIAEEIEDDANSIELKRLSPNVLYPVADEQSDHHLIIKKSKIEVIFWGERSMKLKGGF